MSSTPTNLEASMNTNNTLFESIKIEIDTQSFLLLGLLFCRDRKQQKASIMYSILRGASNQEK